MKKALLVIIPIVILVVAVLIYFNSKKTDSSSTSNNTENGTVAGTTSSDREIKSVEGSDIILFYGEGCPHCKNVEDFIRNNNIDEKVQFDLKEIWYNKDNATLMNQKADICKINKDELGVPFLFDAKNSKCLVGADEIIQFFKDQAEI